MPDTDKSPAVQSLQREQASQRERSSKGALETGLEDSFPASDPVSVTHSSASGGRADVDEAERVLLKHGDEDAVDAARRSTGQDRDAFAGSDPRNRNMRALRRDAAISQRQHQKSSPAQRRLRKLKSGVPWTVSKSASGRNQSPPWRSSPRSPSYSAQLAKHLRTSANAGIDVGARRSTE